MPIELGFRFDGDGQLEPAGFICGLLVLISQVIGRDLFFLRGLGLILAALDELYPLGTNHPLIIIISIRRKNDGIDF